MSLFASAGVIASLAGIAGRSKHIGTGPQVLLAAALVALAAGALLGLAVAWPVLVEEALDPGELRQAIENDPDWGQETEEHLRRASRARLRVADNTRQLNEDKARRLRRGIWCAGAGIVFLLFAVVWVTLDAVLPF